MGIKSRLHRQAVITGTVKPFRTPDITPSRQWLVCGKCHLVMSESRVAEHLKDCQPSGAKCSKCGDMFKPDEFLPHFLNCDGKKHTEVANVG